MPTGRGALSGKVVLLNRSLYGLKQASRSWHKHLVTRVKSLGFVQNLVNPGGCKLIETGSASVVAVVHVDEFLR